MFEYGPNLDFFVFVRICSRSQAVAKMFARRVPTVLMVASSFSCRQEIQNMLKMLRQEKLRPLKLLANTLAKNMSLSVS